MARHHTGASLLTLIAFHGVTIALHPAHWPGGHPGHVAMPPSLISPSTIAIVGATGAVGVELLDCLTRRDFPLAGLRLLASPRSAGRTMAFRGQNLPVEILTAEAFDGVDIALFSAGGAISRDWAATAVERGAVVVDNSSAFRMHPDVPLVVPEVNPQDAAQHRGIVANPNCSTIIAAVPLWPLHQATPIRRIVASTYQAASGGGAAAMAELEDSTRAALEGRDFTPRVLPHPYAFNLFSHNSPIDSASGYNEEELKMRNETRKIFGDDNLRIAATCIRVPVLRAHAISLNIEFVSPISPETVRTILHAAPGVRVVDDREANRFPMPVAASGCDEILVGRIRHDISDPSGHSVALFIAGDQLLKGAALNAVQIAELLTA